MDVTMMLYEIIYVEIRIWRNFESREWDDKICFCFVNKTKRQENINKLIGFLGWIEEQRYEKILGYLVLRCVSFDFHDWTDEIDHIDNRFEIVFKWFISSVMKFKFPLGLVKTINRKTQSIHMNLFIFDQLDFSTRS